MRTPSLFLAATLLAFPVLAQVNDDAKAVLADSAKAIKEVRGIQFETKTYATGMLKDIIDLSGTVRVWYPEGATTPTWRVDGRCKDPGKPDRELHVASDGTTVTWLRYADKSRVTAQVSDPDAREMLGFSRELILSDWTSPTPYSVVLNHFSRLAKTGITTIDGEVCEVVEATNSGTGPKSDLKHTWLIGVKDHLPRSLTMGNIANSVSKVTEMSGLKPTKFTKADFEIALPFGFESRIVNTPAARDTDARTADPKTRDPQASPTTRRVPQAAITPTANTSTPSTTPTPERTHLEADHLEVFFTPIPPADPEFPDPTNAALLYSRAFILLPDDTIKKLDEVITPDNPNWLPDADLTQKLIDEDNVASTLIRASKMDSADFGIEFSQGIGALLPHLSKMRAAARFLAADTRRLIQAQKPDDAADRIAAMFGMARHLTRDRLLISALVASAIHAIACAQTEYLINSAQLTTTGKARILAAMDKFNTPDPFGIKAAVRGERYWVVVWLRTQLAGPDGIKVFLEQMLPAFGDQPSDADLKALNAMDAAAATADLDKSDRYYTSVLEVFDLPDAEGRLGTLEKGIKSGDYGIIARYAAPAMTRAHQQYMKAAARQSESRARLDSTYARP